MLKRRYFLIFFAGAVTGAYLHAWLMPMQKPSVPRAEVVRAGAPEPESQTTSRQLVAGPVVSKDAELSELRPVGDAQEQHPAAATLSLDENLIKELEDSGERLRDAAYAETTDQGWRIRVLRQDDLIVRSGLRDGDVVTYEGLSAQYGHAGRGDLAERVAAVLNSIRR